VQSSSPLLLCTTSGTCLARSSAVIFGGKCETSVARVCIVTTSNKRVWWVLWLVKLMESYNDWSNLLKSCDWTKRIHWDWLKLHPFFRSQHRINLGCTALLLLPPNWPVNLNLKVTLPSCLYLSCCILTHNSSQPHHCIFFVSVFLSVCVFLLDATWCRPGRADGGACLPLQHCPEFKRMLREIWGSLCSLSLCDVYPLGSIEGRWRGS